MIAYGKKNVVLQSDWFVIRVGTNEIEIPTSPYHPPSSPTLNEFGFDPRVWKKREKKKKEGKKERRRWLRSKNKKMTHLVYWFACVVLYFAGCLAEESAAQRPVQSGALIYSSMEEVMTSTVAKHNLQTEQHRRLKLCTHARARTNSSADMHPHTDSHAHDFVNLSYTEMAIT